MISLRKKQLYTFLILLALLVSSQTYAAVDPDSIEADSLWSKVSSSTYTNEQLDVATGDVEDAIGTIEQLMMLAVHSKEPATDIYRYNLVRYFLAEEVTEPEDFSKFSKDMRVKIVVSLLRDTNGLDLSEDRLPGINIAKFNELKDLLPADTEDKKLRLESIIRVLVSTESE